MGSRDGDGPVKMRSETSIVPIVAPLRIATGTNFLCVLVSNKSECTTEKTQDDGRVTVRDPEIGMLFLKAYRALKI